MSTHSRTYNSIANSLFGIVASVISVVLNFFVRVVLVRELGDEINGLHNLFQSITSVMVLMELGISAAMVIHLYEPVKNHDEELTRGIMAFYKQIYVGLAVVFTAVSLLVAFFLLDSLVTTTISMSEVRLFFVVFTVSFTMNYFTYYKRSILYAEQKNRVASAFTCGCELVFRSIQIVLILLFHEYLLFLLVTIAEKVVSNLLCNHYVDKYHPYLRHVRGATLPTAKKRDIFQTVKPLMVNQMANTAQLASRSILISILLGNVAIVGYYGNYQLLTNVASMVYAQFGGAFTTSMGNLAVERDKERMRRAYCKSAFIMDWIACIGCAAFVCCADDFIYLVFGERFVLDRLSVLILSINLAVYMLDIPMISVQNSMGLHRYDAVNMVIQAVLAISLGYVLGRAWGMPGIFIGLLLPLVVFTLLMKGIIIGRKSLDMKAGQYLRFIGAETGKILAVIVLCEVACHLFAMQPSVASLIIKLGVALGLSLVLPALLSFRTEEFRETVQLIKNFKLKR